MNYPYLEGKLASQVQEMQVLVFGLYCTVAFSCFFCAINMKLHLMAQDPCEHGRQHHRALLQRRHLHPRHWQLRRCAEDHADGDLRAREPTRRAEGRGGKVKLWLLVGHHLQGCYWLANKLTDSIGRQAVGAPPGRRIRPLSDAVTLWSGIFRERDDAGWAGITETVIFMRSSLT